MKLALLIFVSLVSVVGGHYSVAADDAKPLQPHVAKYHQDRQALDAIRAKQVEVARTRYVTLLTAARADAVKSNKSGILVAIDAELISAKSDRPSPTTPADLPAGLAGARREFLKNLGTAEKEDGVRLDQLNSRYIETIEALGKTAVQQRNDALAKAVNEEKARVLAKDSKAATVTLHRNAIENGDFSETDEAGFPKGWRPKGADYQGDKLPWQNDAKVIQEGSEKFLRFRRGSPVQLSNVGPVAPILIPERAKAAVVSVKLRVDGLMPGYNYDRFPGVSIKALDGNGRSPGPATAAAKEDTRWREFSAKLVLQPGARTLDVSLGPWAASGICDFDDVVVKFE